MEIYNSLDWPKVQSALLQQTSKIKPQYGSDARRMINNITKMITELSKHELKARRSPTPGPSRKRVEEHVAQINEQIQSIEQWITLLLLY